MGDAVTFLALADRCEREEASRELDAAIFRATGWEGVNMAYVPHLTSSLDAAVTLELPGFFVTVVAGKGQPCAVGWLDAESGVQFNAEAPTEPMARCAAALRARAALERGKDE